MLIKKVSGVIPAAKCVERVSLINGKEVLWEQQRKQFMNYSEEFALATIAYNSEWHQEQQLKQLTSDEARLKHNWCPQ